MHSFKDNEDRPWNVSINVGAIKRVKAKVGVDLMMIDAGDPPLSARLAGDAVLICDVLYVLVEPQAAGFNPPVNDEAFGEGLGGEGFLAGKDALKEELIDFFQKAGRPELAKILTTTAEVVRLATEKIVTRIDGVDLDALATKLAVPRGPRGAPDRGILGEPSTSSPPSPASETSTPSPSGSSPGGPSTANEPAGTAPPT